ncbi:MAG: hypothetical protein LBK08_10330 [Treponema sp.]|jgi:hypothetical protein|nr:hypothetical protein [Treponema sp.]
MQAYDDVYGTLIEGSWPNVLAVNASGPTATDGTPYTAEFINDLWGAREDLMNRAGLLPNSVTEAPGASQFTEALRRGAGMPPGVILHSAANPARLAVCRFLPLEGQIIPIDGAYSELAAAVYCGDALNDTAGAYYKCDSGGNRDVDGTYMVLPDARGVFLRGTGSQTRTVSWTDTAGTAHSATTTYDGGNTGDWQQDRIRDLKGSFTPWAGGLNTTGIVRTGESVSNNRASSGSSAVATVEIDASLDVRTGPDNAPASTSAQICITY